MRDLKRGNVNVDLNTVVSISRVKKNRKEKITKKCGPEDNGEHFSYEKKTQKKQKRKNNKKNVDLKTVVSISR